MAFVASSWMPQARATLRQQPRPHGSAQVDALCPKRGTAGQHEARIVGQLLTLLDGSAALGPAHQQTAARGGGRPGRPAPGHILVVGTTSRPNAVDPALRRAGRWEPCAARSPVALALSPLCHSSLAARHNNLLLLLGLHAVQVVPTCCFLPSAPQHPHRFVHRFLPLDATPHPGCRLEQEVLVGVPDASARASILQLLTRRLPLDATVDLQR